MREKASGGYREIEKENIDKSINRYFVNQDIKDMASDQFDPRVVATIRIAEQTGFSMEAGEYIDLIK